MSMLDIDGALIAAYKALNMGLATGYEGELFKPPRDGSQATITAITLSAAAADNSFNDSASGLVTAGFEVGQIVTISGFTGDTANNITDAVIISVVAGKIIIGGSDGDVIVNDSAGESVTIKTTGKNWAALTIVPAVIDYQSLGTGGTDLHTGFMQIDFSVKHGTGRAVLVGYAQTIRDEFVGGKGYTQNTQRVRIDTVDRSGVRESNGWMVLSVSVNWSSETIRPTF